MTVPFAELNLMAILFGLDLTILMSYMSGDPGSNGAFKMFRTRSAPSVW